MATGTMSEADYVVKLPRRQALRETVQTFWQEDPQKPSGPLDSSLKKHTTLLNKLKSSLLVGPASTFIKEIDGLTLSKYLEEIVGAVVEGATRGKGEPDVAVDVIVHLHTRLTPDFLPLLLPALLSVLSIQPPAPSSSKDEKEVKDREKEEKDRLAKQRPVLRIISELVMVGAWEKGVEQGVQKLTNVLQAFMSGDPQFANLPLMVTFLKNHARVFLGPLPTTSTEAGAAEDVTVPAPRGATEELIPVDLQKELRAMFDNYFDTASKTLIKGHMKLLEQDKKNHEAYIKSGEIFEDRQHAYERMTRAVERLTAGVQSLADLLGRTPPKLPTAAALGKTGLQIINSTSTFLVNRDDFVAGGIWDDEEERRFYEDLTDLSELVPHALLGIKDSKKAEVDKGDAVNGSAEAEVEVADEAAQKSTEQQEEERLQDQKDIKRQLEQLDLETTAPSEITSPSPEDNPLSPTHSTRILSPEPDQHTLGHLEDDDAPAPTAVDTEEGSGMNAGPQARLTALFAALPEASNRDMVDKLAVDFAFLNSKAARKRCIKLLSEVPRNRSDLLPHYARFTATLDRYMPDIGVGLIALLDEEFRYLQRKKRVRELDGVRLKNVRYYSELAKFRVARPHTILHAFKVYLDDFSHNVENVANLLETCGRFLLRAPETAETAKDMVELMRRKMSTQHFDQRQIVTLENAFYMCNPPERVAKEVIQLTPMEAFIQHLLHDVLIKKTIDKVLKLLRKLHWEDPAVSSFILKSFTDVWEIKYGNITYLAMLVFDLQRYHPEFTIAVMDQVMEDIRVGMEENIFKYNQRRISTIKYLGELYMYRVVNAAVIFDVLWSLISFGHPEGLPVPGRTSPIDAVNDFFRVRLVCTLLDTCGSCFDRGSLRKKLDHFLVVFQLYVLCKVDMSMDVDFMLSDTLETLRPKTPMLKTLTEAALAVEELLATQVDEGEDTDTEAGSDVGRIDDVEEEAAEEPGISAVDLDDEDDNYVVRDHKKDEVDKEAEESFDREFARMLADTTDVRRSEPRKTAAPVFDSAVPLIKRKPNVNPVDGDSMQFTLLSKRGNKQHTRTMEIPTSSAIAVNSRSYQLQNKAEQEQLKRLVLANEQRQEQDEQRAIEQQARNRGIKLRFVPS